MSPEDQRQLAEELTATIESGVPPDEVERSVSRSLVELPDTQFTIFIIVGRLRALERASRGWG
jgi:hypothetical protein